MREWIMVVCPGCNKEAKPGWKFCVFCRGPLVAGYLDDSSTSSAFTLDVGDSTIAHRVQPKEMQGLVTKTLVVHQGQQALLFNDGRLDNTLAPGNHVMGNILLNKIRDTTVVLFKTSD